MDGMLERFELFDPLLLRFSFFRLRPSCSSIARRKSTLESIFPSSGVPVDEPVRLSASCSVKKCDRDCVDAVRA
jgi:hypothetical protein